MKGDDKMYKGYTIPIHWELTLDELLEMVKREGEAEMQSNDSSDEDIVKEKTHEQENPR